MMLHSARPDARRARWSILSRPTKVVRLPAGGDPLACLPLPGGSGAPERGEPPIPFAGGWIGYLGYELGRVVEPAARAAPPATPPADDRGWPPAEFGYCPDALLYDNVEQRWHAVGDGQRIVNPGHPDPGAFRAGSLESNVDPDTYLAMVAATIESIAAGDIFQANITHRLTAPFEGSSRRLALTALAAAGAWYGAYLELPEGRCLVSLSPELFLELDGRGGRVVTRPVKGTRPSAVAASTLADSAKDVAELNMIVDLMRNDLGRVCEFGTVAVPRARIIETHPTVHHGVGEVTGVLRPGVSRAELLAAAFPAGSVTGAPKIRAMQIIETLEPVRRGPYCGAIGFLSCCGAMSLSVAIRTVALRGERSSGSWSQLAGELDYGVGGGIVADSKPIDEYRESMDKAAILRQVLEAVSRPRRAGLVAAS